MQFSFAIVKRAWAVTCVGACAFALLSSCIHKKYETPIAKNTQQPDKILFDAAMKDIEHGRYEVARISLQTLMNTYESSEYLAKAKLAIADSWFREGGSNGLGQAEAEYKDFQLFYPQMEEAAQAQDRICDIHYKQMDKSDRDIIQTLRAETECKDLIVQYPNSKFVPSATQKLREVQESLAAHEFVVGDFYHKRQMNPAAANRLSALVDQYPLYSNAGMALYEAGDSYSKMGPRFRKDSGEMFARILRDYPLSPEAKLATKRLQDLEMPIPAANQAALERAKWEKENYKKPTVAQRSMSMLKSTPDVSHAARSGAPTMTDPKRTMPASIPVVAQVADTAAPANGEAGAAPATKTDVTVNGSPNAATTTGTELVKKPADVSGQPLPTNRDKEIEQMKARQLKAYNKAQKKKKKPTDTAAPATTPATTPAATGAPAAATTPSTTPSQPQL
jgi:outer membrane protein assembly factor BamD